MPALNPYLASMPAGYLFREVASRIAAYEKKHPGSRVISGTMGRIAVYVLTPPKAEEP